MKLWMQAKAGEKEASEFLNQENAELDTVLLPYDIYATAAHARALEKAGLLGTHEKKAMGKALSRLLEEWKKGGVKVGVEQEDSHTLIEEWLSEKAGVAGKKIHAGRSRNDQALCMIKLYAKHQAFNVQQAAAELALLLTKKAFQYEFAAMPGYTHSRKAMPSSAGMWLSAYAWLLLQDGEVLKGLGKVLDDSPLGTAAGYGTLVPLDNAATAKALGFAQPPHNAMAAQLQRGKVEAFFVFGLVQTMQTLSRLASDLIAFSAPEVGFVELNGTYLTGSSIMPQKRNPDGLELVRAKAGSVLGDLMTIETVGHGLPSGYHRDLQETKRPLVHAFQATTGSLQAVRDTVVQMKLDTKKMEEACTPEIYAADAATRKALGGKPFRDAYREVAEGLASVNREDAVKNLKAKKALGSPGNLGLATLKEKIVGRVKEVEREKVEFEKRMEELLA